MFVKSTRTKRSERWQIRVFRDLLLRINHAGLHFKNVRGPDGTSANVISFMPKENRAPIFWELTNVRRLCMQISYKEFQTCRRIEVGSLERHPHKHVIRQGLHRANCQETQYN